MAKEIRTNTNGNYDPNALNQHYINKIREMPILTHEEEFKLAKKWRDEGDREAVERLVESHLRLVVKIAAGYRGYGLPLTDLLAEGNVGMMQAMKHYDPERGFRLATYAMWWIKASIQDYILHSWSLVKIGTTSAQKRLFFGLRKAAQQLYALEETELSSEMIQAIAEKLSVKEEEVIQMNYRLSGDRSLNVAVRTGEEESPEWIEWLADDRDDPEMLAIHSDEVRKHQELLDKALACLNQREHEIFVGRRLTEPPISLEDLSETVGLSRERVRQIEIESFSKIRKQVKGLVASNQIRSSEARIRGIV